MPVPGRRGGAPVAWLIVVSERGPLGDFERLTARQGSMVVGLELMRERVVRETERRLAGDLLAEALGGQAGLRRAAWPAAAVRDRRRGGGALFESRTRTAGSRPGAELANAGVAGLVAPAPPPGGRSCAR